MWEGTAGGKEKMCRAGSDWKGVPKRHVKWYRYFEEGQDPKGKYNRAING